jgi:hypothetical protein
MPYAELLAALAVVAVLVVGIGLAEVSLIGALADELQNRTCSIGDDACIHRGDNALWQLVGAGALPIVGCLLVYLMVGFLTRRRAGQRLGKSR